MKLTQGQKQFLKEVEKGTNIFLTGKAGTGKSFVLDLIKKDAVKLGSTGVSALNIGGTTLHSYFWVPIKYRDVVRHSDCYYFRGEKAEQVDASASIIIIDESSMIRADVMQAVESTLNRNENRLNNFNSLKNRQIIFVGDMGQLPPVVSTEQEKEALAYTYGGFNFQDSQIYKDLNVKTIELTEIVRQSDLDFIDALNKLRDGHIDIYWKSLYSKELNEGITIAPTRKLVDKYNKVGLSELDGEEVTYYNSEDGTLRLSNFHLPTSITLKDGAKIIYKFNSKSFPLVNGTLGTFVLKDGNPFIETDSGTYPIEYESFKDSVMHGDGMIEVLGSVSFFPVEVAYAITIHKSQGLTFDKVNVDLSYGFFGGTRMLYVAFSRCRTPEGLNIIREKLV